MGRKVEIREKNYNVFKLAIDGRQVCIVVAGMDKKKRWNETYQKKHHYYESACLPV